MMAHDQTIESLLKAAEEMVRQGEHKQALLLLERICEMLGVTTH
ncbi:hypothetical protein ACIQW5_11225 [Methylorubrum thiocyanatum]